VLVWRVAGGAGAALPARRGRAARWGAGGGGGGATGAREGRAGAAPCAELLEPLPELRLEGAHRGAVRNGSKAAGPPARPAPHVPHQTPPPPFLPSPLPHSLP